MKKIKTRKPEYYSKFSVPQAKASKKRSIEDYFKQSMLEEKQAAERREKVVFLVKPTKFLNPYTMLKLAGEVYLPVLSADQESILGELMGTTETLGAKIRESTFNFEKRSVEIKYENFVLDTVPLEYVKERLISMSSVETQKALLSLQHIYSETPLNIGKQCTDEQNQERLTEMLESDCWIPSITYIDTLSLKDGNRSSRQILNSAMIKLMGVYPITLIDAVTQSQMIPTVLCDIDYLKDWNKQVSMFIGSHNQITQNIEEIYVNTFEGKKILANMKESYFQFYNEQQQSFKCIKKRAFSIQNIDQLDKLFSDQRLQTNTLLYNSQTQLHDKSHQMANDLHIQSSSELRSKYKNFKHCSYRQIC